MLGSQRTARAAPDLDAELDRRLAELAEPAQVLAELNERLRARGILFGEKPIPTFLRPHLLPGALFDRWIEETEALFGLLERVAQRALVDRALAGWLGFSDEALALCQIDPGYARHVVVARPDAVNDGARIRFLEVNSDSPAMMTFADEVEEILCELPPLAALATHLKPSRRAAALYQALRACFEEWGGKGAPSVAIVDWPGEKTAYELVKTAERFQAMGAEALVAGPADLRYEDGRLLARGRPIDLVYRRVLFSDFLTRQDELAPLIAAYRAGKVCMVNPLRSYLVGTKALLALLRDPSNPADLTPEERALTERVIPETTFQRDGDLPERGDWVLKKAESYGGQDVVVGSLVDDAVWARAIDSAKRARWVRQRREEIPTVALPVLDGAKLTFQRKFLNWNPFVFGGRHGGSIARVSDSILINISRGGGLLPTVRVGE
jgi:hypothetical protein